MPLDRVLPLCAQMDARRRALHWTVVELAQRSGYSANTVRNCLHGKNVHLDTYLIIATTLGYEIEVRLVQPAA